MKKIFVWSAGFTDRDDVMGYAMTEAGNVLASHFSSNPEWAKHDMGVTSNWKHDAYAAAFPDGYELVWLDNPMSDPDFMAAYTLNLKRIDDLCDKIDEEAQA